MPAKKLNGCKTGEAKITPGFKLPAKYVIHTVGPVWNNNTQEEDDLLAACYQNALHRALENDIQSIAFPSISTGVYRFPLVRACKIALKTVIKFSKDNPMPDNVVFVMFSDHDFETMKNTYEGITK